MIRRFLVPTKLILISGIILFWLFLLSKIGSADTITVDNDGGADFEKIQDAVNSSEDGDTIRVWEGTYYENVVVNKSVSLIGNGSANTTIDGRGNESVVTIASDWVKIGKFSIINSGKRNPLYRDSGIKVISHGIYIFDTRCTNNFYGISLISGNASTLDSNRCYDNVFYGILLINSSYNVIMNNTCMNNTYGIFIGYLSFWNTLSYNICSTNENSGIYIENHFRMKEGNNTLIFNNCSNNSDGILLT